MTDSDEETDSTCTTTLQEYRTGHAQKELKTTTVHTRKESTSLFGRPVRAMSTLNGT